MMPLSSEDWDPSIDTNFTGNATLWSPPALATGGLFIPRINNNGYHRIRKSLLTIPLTSFLLVTMAIKVNNDYDKENIFV